MKGKNDHEPVILKISGIHCSEKLNCLESSSLSANIENCSAWLMILFRREGLQNSFGVSIPSNAWKTLWIKCFLSKILTKIYLQNEEKMARH